MSTHGHTTIRNPTSKWSPPRPMDRGRGLVLAVGLLAALSLLTAAALVVRLGQLGWVVGEVGPAAGPGIQARPDAWRPPSPGAPPACWPASTLCCTACWCR